MNATKLLEALEASLPHTDMDSAQDIVGGFSAEGTLPAGSLTVSVNALGDLSVPLQPSIASKLSALSTPAPFGHGEDTVHDLAVRNTGEISADDVGLGWQGSCFAKLQDEVAQSLGLPAVELTLHKLLVYGPGQFFKEHQDTEKLPGMVATVVLIVPSAHIGGDIVVTHERGQRTASKTLVSEQLATEDTTAPRPEWRWFAFYADCRHEVLPVRQGWRIALTFDATVGTSVGLEAPLSPSATFERALRQYFSLPKSGNHIGVEPWVLMLEHEYSQRGLRWPLLKGADRAYAARVKASCVTVGLSVHLAHLQRHECWHAPEMYSRYDRRRGLHSPSHPEPQDLIEASYDIDYWVNDQNDVCSQTSMSVIDDCVVGSLPIGPEHLEEEEYEGYMGNYGETLDYWYRRSALVVQSPMGLFITRLKTEVDAVVSELVEVAQSIQGRSSASPKAKVSDEFKKEVQRFKSQMQLAMHHLQAHARGPNSLVVPHYLRLAVALGDANEAKALLWFLGAVRLKPLDMPELVALEREYGAEFLVELLNAWTLATSTPAEISDSWRYSAPHHDPKLDRWPTQWAKCLKAAVKSGLSAITAQRWVDFGVSSIDGQVKAWFQLSSSERQQRRGPLFKSIAQLCEAIAAAPEPTEAAKGLIDALLPTTETLGAPIIDLSVVVTQLGQVAFEHPAKNSLGARIATTLERELSQPPRADNDHSLRGLPWRCRCLDCKVMIDWAESSTPADLEMPIAEQRRSHVCFELQWVGAGVATTTIKRGSPYRLVLTKPSDLHRKEALQRVATIEALRNLRASR